MRVKGFIISLLVSLLGLGLTGCSSTQPPSHEHSHESHHHSGETNANPDNAQVEKAIKDELNGLANIENKVNKNDFQSAGAQFEQLHEEYHSAVLPPIEAKNTKLAEDMHSKFDELEDAINGKDKAKTLNMIKENRDNLYQAAKELGISLNK
jgi:molecular chaperone GrpE (heat shock protein)